MEAERADACSDKAILEYLKTTEAKINPSSFAPELTFNVDETMLSFGESKSLVVIPHSQTTATTKTVPTPTEHITLVLCIDAAGGHTETLCILPLKNLPRSLDLLSPKFSWAGQDSGWIDLVGFSNWVDKIFLPAVEERRKRPGLEDKPALLWVDGHSSRTNADVMTKLKANNVVVACIPSHTSHILQPLDNGVNGTFKTWLAAHMPKRIPSSMPEARYELLRLAARSLYHAFESEAVQAAFDACGLYPWDPEKLVNDPTKVNSCAPPTPPKRKAIAISGRVLTDDDVILELMVVGDKRAVKAEKVKAEKVKAEKVNTDKPKSPETPPKKAKTELPAPDTPPTQAATATTPITPKRRGRPQKEKK
jgi:hypothetical protein